MTSSALKTCYKPFIYTSKVMSRFKLEHLIFQDLPEDYGNMRILFVGSGGSLNEMVECRYSRSEITTIDIDPERKPDIVMDVTKLDFDRETFDLVFVLEVLEHVKEPYLAVCSLREVLKSNGQIVVSTPFILGIHDEPYDFYRYTKHGLRYLFREYTDVQLFARTGLFSTIAILISRVISGKTVMAKLIGSFLTVAIFPFFWIGLFVDKFMSDSVTTGYVLHAKK